MKIKHLIPLFVLKTLIVFNTPVYAQKIVVSAGVELNIPDNIDATYQVIPEIDEKQKYIAVWNDKELKYAIYVSKLPSGWLDPKIYLGGYYRDIKAAYNDAKLGKGISFTTSANLKASALEILLPKESKSTIAFHILDAKNSYIASVTTFQKNPNTDLIFQDSANIIRTARIASSLEVPVDLQTSEYKYVGEWNTAEDLPNGQSMFTKVILENNLNFRTESYLEDKLVFKATGVWSVNKNLISWTYLYSYPELPSASKKDEDEIITFENNVLILKSLSSGRIHSYQSSK